jgi:hypothetical protein
LLSSLPSNVAASLTLLLGADGETEAIERAASVLAANSKRRVLVLLLIHVVNGRIPELAPKLATLMPSGHPALDWALGGEIDWKDDHLLSDLGERSMCSEVFVFYEAKLARAFFDDRLGTRSILTHCGPAPMTVYFHRLSRPLRCLFIPWPNYPEQRLRRHS